MWRASFFTWKPPFELVLYILLFVHSHTVGQVRNLKFLSLISLLDTCKRKPDRTKKMSSISLEILRYLLIQFERIYHSLSAFPLFLCWDHPHPCCMGACVCDVWLEDGFFWNVWQENTLSHIPSLRWVILFLSMRSGKCGFQILGHEAAKAIQLFCLCIWF